MTEAEERGTAAEPDGAGPPEAESDASLTATIEALTTERDKYLDQLQRTAAEYANYRRRTESERSQQRLQANETLLREILPVLDDMQRGLNALPESERDSPLASGFRSVEQKFLTALRKQGVTPIEALGLPFDPAVHEAVELDPAGGDTVVAVYAPGYRLGENTLRPAMVKVGPGA
ncbi:MAG: nucleotide exchange factor GrpE [Thermomicrobiales bacterium]